MKFSHSLKYNSVPGWQEHYLNYSQLKKLIYNLQSQDLRSLNENSVQQGVVIGEDLKTGSSKKLSFKKWKEKSPFKSDKNGTKSPPEDDFNVETVELSDMRKKSKNKLQSLVDFDRRSSVSSDPTLFSPQDTFLSRLVDERTKIDDFYKTLEVQLYSRFDTLVGDLEKVGALRHEGSSAHLRRRSSTAVSGNPALLRGDTETAYEHGSDEEDDEEEDFDGEGGEENTALLTYSDFNIKSQKRAILKKNIIDLYVDLAQLKSFIELNRIGFLKITKKFDKNFETDIRGELIESGEFFKDVYVFQAPTLEVLNFKIMRLIDFFAVTTNKDISAAKDELRSYLRDFIVWERNTVWKDMLGLESHDTTFASAGRPSANGDITNLDNTNLEYYSWKLRRPINFKYFVIDKISIPKLFFTIKSLKIFLIIALTAILLGVTTFTDQVEHRCMALVACVAFLWATEAIPLFVTAFLVPLLVVLFRVLRDSHGHVMTASAASSQVLSLMWSSTIMVLLAGFTLAAALSKYNIAKVLASYLLAFAGTKPANVLLMVMGVVFFLSMWISNVAAPVLTYSLIQPLLKSLDTNSPFARALVLGVAMSANVGGMASPISSPQNIISMNYLKPYGVGWGQFFAIALPSGILSMLLIWVLLILTFDIKKTQLKKYSPIKERFTLKQYYIIFVCLGTIILWCVLSKLQNVFGSSGQIAILPIILFFGTGLLTTQDINNFPWSIVILAMGGIALGGAVSSSGLLTTIATALEKRIMDYPLYAVLIIFGVIMLVVGTFVSHTVSAIIIIPLMQEIGDKLPNAKAAPILVFGCALLSSCGMGLASSGFPNVTAISMTDEVGNRYLNVNTFITRGVPSSFLAFISVITLGFGIMNSVLHGAS
ncbi:LAMI_0G07624g1_1 [Lachancea mirantina]|uniref:LAMI_0G07624g1_1 n=1 Tax=Lachancea mirantina TaxID=1230905 RepID=A0A1G4K9K0_9SACH|nr:LAMI_0G07624g1_1 [Lachancea mirantina]